jgi:tetratricopeptide (TPR) repeat protein
MPLWQRWALLAAIVLLASAGSYTAYTYFAEKRLKAQISGEWANFEQCADRLDLAGMQSALNRLELFDSARPLAQKRRRSLERGQADADDPIMMNYWINRYVVENRIPDASREARQRIVNAADDWQSNCVLAHEAYLKSVQTIQAPAVFGLGAVVADAAWRQARRQEAVHFLEQLPSPLAGHQAIGIGGIRYAFYVHRLVGFDDSTLRKFRFERILPALRDTEVGRFGIDIQLELLQMYLDALQEDIRTFNGLTSFWVGSFQVAQNLMEDPKLGFDRTVRLAQLEEIQLAILGELERNRRFDHDKAVLFEAELKDRLKQIWNEVRKQDPTHPVGILGMAKIELYANRLNEAMELVDTGEQQCADDHGRLAIVQFEFQLLRKHYRYGVALERMETIAKRNEGNREQGPILHMLAQCARAAGKPQRVLEITAHAKKLAPNEYWPFKEEARVYLDRENSDAAFKALERCRQYVIQDAEIAELYVRALALTNAEGEIKALLNRLAAEAAGPQIACPALQTAVAKGYYALAGEAARALVARFPDNRDVLLAVGTSHRALAEPQTIDDAWHVNALRIAIHAFDDLHVLEPDNLEVSEALVYLQLKGLHADDTANAAAEVLRRQNKQEGLFPRMADTLAAVEISQMRYDEARKLLLIALRDDPTASMYVHLALAFYHLNMPADARKALSSAASFPRPRTPRVSQELKVAASLIDGTTP